MIKYPGVLLNGKGIDYSYFKKIILKIIGEDVSNSINTILVLSSFILITSLLKIFSNSPDSSVTRVVNIVCTLIISTYLINIFINYIGILKQSILVETEIISIISPFIIGVLMLTGLSVTVGLIQPILLLLLNSMGLVIPYIVVPLISLSIIFNLISSISTSVNLSSLAKTSNKIAIWVVTIIFTIFLALIGIETAVATSIDSVAIKTSQAALSDLVPLVGKFVSDSIEFVVGAASVIGKSAGVVGIVVILLIALSPVIKLTIISISIGILVLIAEMINVDQIIVKLIQGFSSTCKTMLGILTGVTVMYIISIGILINLFKQIVS